MEGETGASVICSGGAQASTSHLRQFLRISFLRISFLGSKKTMSFLRIQNDRLDFELCISSSISAQASSKLLLFSCLSSLFLRCRSNGIKHSGHASA